MVHYKLKYFPVRGRGEHIRQLFKISGVKFEDELISPEDWPQLKSHTPLGQIPVLEVDGQQIAQSLAILRFLGHQFNRAGRNAVECAKLDMIADYVQDMTNVAAFNDWSKVLFGWIDTDKNAYFKEQVMPVVEQFAPTVEHFLLANGNNLFAGDDETWVDIFVAEVFSRIQDFGNAQALSAYPHIEQLIKRIHSHPAIKHHLQHRAPAPC